MSDDCELGVNSCCYEKYKCPTCHRLWDSASAKREFGQECRSCRQQVNPHHIKESFWYHCADCPNVRRSKWSENGLPCLKCGEVRSTSRNHPEVSGCIMENLKPHHVGRYMHDSGWCEKCQIFGDKRCHLSGKSRAKIRRKPEMFLKPKPSVALAILPANHCFTNVTTKISYSAMASRNSNANSPSQGTVQKTQADNTPVPIKNQNPITNGKYQIVSSAVQVEKLKSQFSNGDIRKSCNGSSKNGNLKTSHSTDDPLSKSLEHELAYEPHPALEATWRCSII